MDVRLAPDVDVTVTFPTVEGKVTGLSAEITRAHDQMQRAQVAISRNLLSDQDRWFGLLVSGTPLVITWQGRGQYGEFHGYLHTIERVNEERMTLLCVGLEGPLSRAPARASAGTTTKSVFATVCMAHRLQYSMGSTAVGRNNIAQGSLNDWQWIQQIAQREALSCHFRGATLLAHSRKKIIHESVAAALDVEVPREGSTRVLPLSQSVVRSFRHSDQVMTDDKGGAWFHGFMDRDGNISSVVTGKGTPNVNMDSLASPGEVLAADQNVAHRGWNVTADLVMDGVAALHPLDVVRTRYATSQNPDAAWSVISVTHRIGKNDYTVECHLGLEESADRPGPLLLRPANVMDPFMWKTTNGLGTNRWFSRPVLRPTGKVVPGQAHHSSPESYRWTAEVVNIR